LSDRKFKKNAGNNPKYGNMKTVAPNPAPTMPICKRNTDRAATGTRSIHLRMLPGRKRRSASFSIPFFLVDDQNLDLPSPGAPS